MYYQQNYDYQRFLAYKQNEKRRLSEIGKKCGAAVIAFLLSGFLLGFILFKFKGFVSLYSDNPDFVTLFEGLLSVITLFIPFAIACRALKKKRLLGDIPFEKPRDTADFLLLVPIVILICLIGEFLTSNLSAAVDSLFGIEFIAPEDPSDYSSPAGILISLFSSAVIPAFVEEFAIRGVVLQSLRRYGDVFAIIMSSFVFALMHGNMIQIPFAFCAGIGLGYTAIKTRSIWPGILAHFLNNGIAVTMLSVSENFSEKAYIKFVIALYTGIVALGIFCCLLFYKKNGNALKYLYRGKIGCLSTGEKISGFLCNVPMMIAIAALVIETATFVNANG